MNPVVVNIKDWIKENSHLLKTPISNKCIYKGKDFIVMLVTGPNDRQDFHINGTEELFYQIQGDLLLKVIIDDGSWKDIFVTEGSIFLLPPSIPHSPQRKSGTIGLVIEVTRPPGTLDTLHWYCPKCKQITKEYQFKCEDIDTQLEDIIKDTQNVNNNEHKCQQK